ncbi:MAG: RNA 2',3'-cyclic phosphodiesterase [Nocardioidaceae bacterium]
MRLFVGVELPPPVRAHLEARLQDLRDLLPGWRWAPSSQWHVTLAFLGEVPPERLPELTRRMGLAARRHRPFDLTLEGLKTFDSPRRARVLWVGVGGSRRALSGLADSVSAGARRAKIELDDRRFRPHVTVGRRRTPDDLRDVLAQRPEYAGPGWQVSDFVLVESHLGASVRHQVRERFTLG